MRPLLALVVLASAASAQSGGLVVLNKAETTASLVDLASGAVAATLPTGIGPHEVAEIDLEALAVTRWFDVGSMPDGIAVVSPTE